MTRGALALIHGDVLGSLALNPGIVLAIVAALALLWWRPRMTIPTWLPFAIVAGLWTFQLAKYATASPL
jgi:hypothetical protein